MKKKMFVASLAMTAGLLLLTGCKGQSETAQAAAPEKITIVQMPDENNPDAGTKHEGFHKDMEKVIGLPVEEMEGADYSVGIEALKAGKLDVLLVSPMSYYQAKKIAGAEPLVTTTSMGAEPYRTVFITREDNNSINELKDLKDKNFAFVDPASSSGYMYPKTTLVKDLALDTGKLETPGYFFKTVAYSGKHDASILGVVKGDYDAAAVAGQTIPMLVNAGLIKKNDLKIIGETEVIPNALFVVRKDLDENIKKKLKDFYLSYDNADYFKSFYGAGEVRFTEAHDSDYAVVKEMVDTLGIEEE